MMAPSSGDRMPLPVALRPRFPAWLACLLAVLGLGGPIRPVHGQFTEPPRGLNTLSGRTLSFGYLNALRNASGTTAQKMAALNYDGVDVVLLAFATLNADGTLAMSGNAANYRSALIANAHARSKSVLFSVVGAFETVAADPTLRTTLANSVVSMLEQYGFDGVDFDWEWPNTATERGHFTAMMQAVHGAVKARSTNYILCFVQGPGYWLAGTDWTAVSSYADFCFMVCYDWKNPANGPIRKPGSIQYLGLAGGSIEASGKGAIDYAVANGFPRGRIVLGMPFYGSDVTSWFNVSALWEADRAGYLAAIDPDSREVLIDGGWHTSPDSVKRKMDALLDSRTSALDSGATVRGVGFWEFGHEATADPQLSGAIAAWKNGNRSVTGPATAEPAGTTVLIDHGPGWRYFDSSTATPAATWKDRAFDDSGWRLGATPLGFGDGDENTVVDPVFSRITTYFRRAFAVASPAAVKSLSLRLVRDDGAVVYLNGTEVFRSNLPTGPVSATQLANVGVSTGPEESTTAYVTEIPASLLVAGTNVLAVEIHQSAITSSDITMDAQLIAGPQAEPVLVPAHAWWRFSDAATAPGATWTQPSFNDSAWPAGRGRLGYGNDGEWTPLTYGADAAAKPISAYFRHTFMLSGASRYGALRVRIQRDDAAVVYLNGQELFRDNLADGPITPATMATLSQGGADETAWRTFIAPSKSLTDGKNTVAVEVHQSALNSSDLGLDLEMTGIVFPTLAITRSGSQIVLAIPAGATQWAPETSTTLSGPWSPLTTTPIFVGDEKRYSINPTDTRQFYRLGRTGD